MNEYEVYIDCTSAERLHAQTGKYPAILGLELMNAIAYPPYPSYLVDRALTQSAQGGLVTMSWHERNPVEVCQRGEYFECAKKAMPPETLRAVLTPGTRENKLWRADAFPARGLRTRAKMRARNVEYQSRRQQRRPVLPAVAQTLAPTIPGLHR